MVVALCELVELVELAELVEAEEEDVVGPVVVAPEKVVVESELVCDVADVDPWVVFEDGVRAPEK